MIVPAIRSFSLMAAIALLAGCAGVEQNGYSYAYSDRYGLGAPRVERIDVNANPTPQDTARIARISRDFVRSGAERIVIFVPQTGAGALSSGQWVKQELMANGVAARHIQWDARPLPAGIVRIAFSARMVRGRSDCSNLGEDLQQFENQTSYLNRETVNFGCSYNANLLAQADNPNDFIHPRIEGAMDPIRAANAVRQRRNATAPTTPTVNATPTPTATP